MSLLRIKFGEDDQNNSGLLIQVLQVAVKDTSLASASV